MNQKMTELYQQALEFAYANVSKEYWNTDQFHSTVSGKFGEAIVKECAGLAQYYWTRNEYLKPQEIRRHFGVE